MRAILLGIALLALSASTARSEKRFREADDAAVRRALAAELDRWLRAAGFEPTEGFTEITC